MFYLVSDAGINTAKNKGQKIKGPKIKGQKIKGKK